MFKYSLIAFLSLFFLNSIYSQKFTNKSLQNFVLSSDVLSKAHVGISVYGINDKKEILSYNSEKHFIPASVLKLFYTLAAIETKGDNFQFKTKFYYTGILHSNGTLEGDILIFPSGDPTFGSKRFYKNGFLTIFNRIKSELENSGIKCIEGDIVIIYPDRS